MRFTYQVSVDARGRRSLARVSTMRPWEREQPSPPPPASPPRSSKGALSSLVVRPSDEEVARDRGDDLDAAPEPLRLPEPSPSPPRRSKLRRSPDGSGHGLSGRSASPSHHRRAELHRNDHFLGYPGRPYGRQPVSSGKNDSGPRDHSSTYDRGRGRENFRDTSPPYDRVVDGGRFREHAIVNSHGRGRGGFRPTQFGRGSGRGFRNYSPPAFERERDGGQRDFPPAYGKDGQRDFLPAYGRGRGRGRMRDISPLYENRSARRYRSISPVYDPDGGRGGFRGISPRYSPRRDARIFNRNFSGSESEELPVRDEGAARNNPNIPPRVGDWICRNPLCGNLNFARREYCNNCKKFRYEPGEGGRSSSPRQEYAGVPRTMDPPPVMRPVGRRSEREVDGYRSPPRRWGRGRGSPSRHVPRFGGRFPGAPVHREILDDQDEGIEYRGREKFARLSPQEWGHKKRGRDELLQETREYDRDDNHWVQRERSRSPVRDRLPKDTHLTSVGGRGHGDRLGAARGRGRGLF